MSLRGSADPRRIAEEIEEAVTWVSFFAARDDLLDLMRFVYAETDCRVFEAYSLPDQKRRDFQDVVGIASLLDESGGSQGPHLALWSPSLGPPPIVRRITFAPGAVPGHTHRFVTEGCDMITLLCGGLANGTLVASRLGWWTEASALRKADPQLRPELVNWPALTALGRKLRNHVTRSLRRATAGTRPVLGQAYALSKEGIGLRDDTQPTANLVVVPA